MMSKECNFFIGESKLSIWHGLSFRGHCRAGLRCACGQSRSKKIKVFAEVAEAVVSFMIVALSARSSSYFVCKLFARFPIICACRVESKKCKPTTIAMVCATHTADEYLFFWKGEKWKLDQLSFAEVAGQGTGSWVSSWI